MPTKEGSEKYKKEFEAAEQQSKIRFEQAIIKYKEAIIKQANAMENGWFELLVHSGDTLEVYKVPRAPFENWAFNKTNAQNLATPWKTVCPRGIKMEEDDPYHTDFIVGAGIPFDQVYGTTSTNVALLDASQELLEKRLKFQCFVLSGQGVATGIVVHPSPDQKVEPGSIVVIPHGDVKYFISMVTACKDDKGAVIIETGGAVCHLVVNGRPHNFRIVRVKHAMKLYPEGAILTVNCSCGIVRMSAH